MKVVGATADPPGAPALPRPGRRRVPELFARHRLTVDLPRAPYAEALRLLSN